MNGFSYKASSGRCSRDKNKRRLCRSALTNRRTAFTGTVDACASRFSCDRPARGTVWRRGRSGSPWGVSQLAPIPLRRCFIGKKLMRPFTVKPRTV
ncbi:unnamed protein product, partial [Iphiclides podalirius]